MRLTLILPCIGREKGQKKYIKTWLMEPLAPAVLASLTPKDVEIKFYDDRLEPIPYDESTDLVSITVETYTAKRSYQIASEYRKRKIPVIMGGFHATLSPDEVAEYAECVVVGEAEHLWGQIIEDFKRGQLKKIYHQSGRPSLQSIHPDRSIFQGKNYMPLGLVEAGRGCLLKCDFCAVQSYYKSTHVRRPTENIIKELTELKKVGRKLIFFVDDNIFSHIEQSKEFFKALIPLNIRWVSQGSIQTAFDEEFLQIIKASGCLGLLVGFESINSDNLKSMRKTFNLMKGGYDTAIKNFKKYGIRLYPTFIFGYPDDDKEIFARTVEFAIKHKFFIAAFNHLIPFPGTPLYQRLKEEKKLFIEKWWLDDKYRYGLCPVNGYKLTGLEIKKYCNTARKAFFSIPSIFRRCDRINCSDAFTTRLFFSTNFLFRKEIDQRLDFPLGDRAFCGSLIKAKN